MRNRVERSFRYLKERTIVFHHQMSKKHIYGIKNLKLFLNLFIHKIYHRTTMGGNGWRTLIRTYYQLKQNVLKQQQIL